MTQDNPEAKTDSGTEVDSELTAIGTLIKVLGGLDTAARDRVLSYALQRLGMTLPIPKAEASKSNIFSGVFSLPHSGSRLSFAEQPTSPSKVHDIRSFAEEKVPKSANERAAVVAYFLSELASPSERKDSINQDDITKYFKQARFLLPSSPSMTLVHAKNAGYFESESPGQYRLNAVGYNLVAHRLPQDGEKSVSRKSNSRRATKPKSPAKPKTT